MKIGMVVDNEYSGDIRVQNEAKALVLHGYTVKVLAFSFGDHPTFEKVNGVDVYRIRINKKIKNILFAVINILPIYHYFWYYHICSFAKKHNLKAIHAHDLYMAYAAGKASRRLDIPMILDLHENYPEAIREYQWTKKFPGNIVSQTQKWRKNEGKYLQLATKIITLSNSFALDLSKRYPSIGQNNFWVYPNVPDIDEMLSYKVTDTGLDTNRNFFLLYFGRISQRRGIYTCIEAMKILIKKYKNIVLLLIGPIDGHEALEMKNAITKNKIHENIIHIPWIDISQLPSYISLSQICLSPIIKNAQHESGVANKIFQYMLFSKPIIVSNCMPQVEIVEEVNCGFVFESDNHCDLAQKVELLYNDPGQRNEMGERGKSLVLSKFNLNHYGDLLVKNYQELFGQE